MGRLLKVDFNPSSSKSSYQDLPEEERQKIKDLLFILLAFSHNVLFSEKWVCKQVLNDHNLLCSLQCKKPFDLLMIMSNHR
jgi:mRNA-degrading endonuclease RelE of RelBE toxin-antitoxin system